MKNLELGQYFYELAQTQYFEESRYLKTNPSYAKRCLKRAENAIAIAELLGYDLRTHLAIQGWY
ncbi:MAG: hypothetical protein AAFV71_26255 [Cyanobacteria bacterium J06633_8]